MALTFPSSPTNGQIFTDTTTGNRYIWDSARSIWKSAANNVGMSVSSTPPGNVAPGALWFNREIGRTFVYYDDGDSSQWVETVPAGAVDTNTIAAYTNPVFASMNGAYTTANAGFGVANAAFGVANTALQNTNVTLAGNLTVTGNVVANKQVVVTYTPATSVNAVATLAGANTQGGTGYVDFLKASNLSGGATNPHKTFRLNSTGGIEVINSAYSAVIASITDGGYLNLPYQPKFYAYNASSSGNLTTTTWTKVALDTKEFDIGNNFNTTTNRFTAPVSGYYLFIGHVNYNQNNDNVTYGARFYKNGTGDSRSSFRFYTAGAVDTRGIHEVNTTMIFNLSAGDYIELYGFCEGTADQTINGGSNLLGYLLP